MGAFTAYSISVAIILAVEYIVYQCLLANTTFYRFNRRVLLACYVVALLAVPAAHILPGLSVAGEPADMQLAIGHGAVTGVAEGSDKAASSLWVKAIPVVYMAGVAITALLTLVSYAGMWRLIRSGSKRSIGQATMVVIDRPVSPFSWGRYVVISAADAADGLIVEHELRHIRHRHSFDLIFAQMFVIFNWFNPAAYLMRRALSAVHEYEVDHDILTSGVAAFDYQMLLIKKTVGPRFQSIANSLNHSQLKNRLTMMQKSRSKRGRSLCAVALLPAALLAVSMTDIPAVATTISDVAAVSYGKSSENLQPAQEPAQEPAAAPVADDNNTRPAAAAPEIMPQYPGGEKALLQAVLDEIAYPEVTINKEGASGLTVVGFMVNTDGTMSDFKILKSSGYGDLDAEAIRAVREGLKEKWTPGYTNGKPVSCRYALPVRFKTKSK